MSARDAESGSSTYKGGSGRAGGLGNGGVGGGMGGGGNYGGGMGGGAARNGGIGSRTGLTGGTTMYGNTAYGRAGGNVQAYGMRDARSLGRAGMGPTAGTYSNFRTPSGQAMFGSSPVQGQSFRGMNMGQALSQAQRAQAAYEAAQRPSVPGLLGGAPTAAGAPANVPVGPQYPAYDAEMALPEYPPVQEINIPFPDEPVPASPYSNTIVTGMPSPEPSIGGTPPTRTLTYKTPGGWPGQNTYYSRGQVVKAFNDRVPQDPSFRGNATGYSGGRR